MRKLPSCNYGEIEMKKAKIAVLVSGGGTNLQALIDAQTAKTIVSGEIALIISNNSEAYALERGKKAGIATEVVIKEKGNQRGFEDKISALLSRYEIDFIVLAGFMSILSEAFTSMYPKRIINIHPSLIPSFCGEGYYGLRVHKAALDYGVKVTGATVHYVNEIPDGGEIILQKAVAIMPGDTPEILQHRVMEQAEWEILPLATEMVAQQIIKG